MDRSKEPPMPRILSQDDVADFRERLCDVAERLFAEQGPQAVSMRQLAAELGVSPMTPYRYFKDKDDILAAVRASGFDRFADALETAHASAQTADERARAVGDAYVRFALDHPAAYRLMFDLEQPTEAEHSELSRAATRARVTLTQYIDSLIAAGLIEGDPMEVALSFWAALHGLIVLQLAGKLGPGVDFDHIRGVLMTALARGFRPRRGS
jgi:AcrR family transcriptional regulator